MISVSGRKWQERKNNLKIIEKIQQDYNFSKLLSQLIVSRNFDEKEIHLIENDLELSNIFQNNHDFIKGIQLLENIIKNKENICIFGDYDVDGSAATSLFVKIFQNLNHPYFFCIPDREKDGYGPNIKLFKKLLLKKPKLVIMVDCGSTNIDAINFLNKNKIQSLIIDHHEMHKPFPKANVIINPKKNDGYLEYDYLCATSLTYFFLEIFVKKMSCKVNLRKYLIYVLLATVCDVMPLRKLNRLISIIALKEFNLNNIVVFKELFNLSNKKNKININDLGYLVGPMLNSGGRLGKSNYAAELLSTNDPEVIKERSVDLFNLNEKRKIIENNIMNSINFNKILKENNDIIVFYEKNINEGLIGIIAARLKEYFDKPSIVITDSKNLLKGSARSIYNYNIGRTMKNLLDKKIILNGGGHNMAAGFTLKKENFSKLKEFIINDFLSKNFSKNFTFSYDAELSTTAINNELVNDIKKIGPFGCGNPEPIFLFKSFKIIKSNLLNKKHISSILKSKSGSTFASIAFNSFNTKTGEHLLNYKKDFNLIAQINENIWNNKKTLQLVIKDLIL